MNMLDTKGKSDHTTKNIRKYDIKADEPIDDKDIATEGG